MLKTLVPLVACAMLTVVVPAGAEEWNKKTVITFSQPVELPGTVLPAGTYVFKLADSLWDRHIVRVFNADESHLFATILAIPNFRLNATSETVLKFTERRKDAPEALRAWFYPADGYGQEFVYPRKRAVELAETAKVPVLTAPVLPTEAPEQLIKEPVVAVTPEKKEVEIAQVVTLRPMEAPPALIANTEPVPQLTSPEAAAATATELPSTASFLPLLVLTGLCSLGVFAGLKAVSKRIA